MTKNAARLNDLCTGHDCYSTRPNITASGDIFINNRGAHRQGDQWATHCCDDNCHSSSLAAGSSVVLCNNRQMGRVSDPVACGSRVMTGSPDVFIGDLIEDISAPSLPEFQAPTQPNSFENAQPLIQAQGYDAVDDEPATNDGVDQFPPGEAVNPPPPEPTDPPPPPTDCVDIKDPVDYRVQLSPNVTLGNLTINALYPHGIRAQLGLTVPDVACNLKALAENIIEPVIAQFGRPRFNSGFRTITRGKSQHEFGQAVDMQWPNFSPRDPRYQQVAEFIRDNLVYDQLILEHGNAMWVHCSFNREGNRPASSTRKNLTYYRKKYSPGLRIFS